VPIAVELGAKARRAGRRGIVVYDVIDAILDSNNYANVPPPLLDRYRKKEAGWVRKVDAVVTVNEALADHCERIWPFRERPTVLFNGQERWDPPARRPDLIRDAARLPKERAVVLYLGRLGRERGLEHAAEAVLRLTDAALVMLGFPVTKGWDEKLAKQQADPRFAGRYIALPPVHPDEVRIWAASADVSIIAVPANSLNQRLSTPNKFWESLAAGTPVVLGRDLEVMRAMVEADRLGAVADPEDPEDLARALREGRLLDAAGTRELVGDHPGMAVAGGTPGVNALLELEGPYTLVVLTNLDPPAAEHFSRTIGRLLRRAAGDDFRGPRHEVRAGGPAREG
jgi:glycosyltransferase involved in cell wall biosynthesis